jgi:hypothetical protein
MQTLLILGMLTFGQAADPAPHTLRFEEGMTRPAAAIADMAWLAGTWEGEGLGGTVDEIWTAPAGGAMAGFFRLVRDGKPVFYELLTILEHEGSLEMRLKHANPDMTGWEEKNNFVTFKLVKLDETGAYFGGFTLKRVGPDTLEGYLALRDRASGAQREEKFTFRRLK